jgi:D-3-phosphoglycerate dehydrogenase
MPSVAISGYNPLMEKKVILCAADLSHIPEARAILEQGGQVRFISPTPDELALHLPAAHAYYAALSVQLTGEMLAAAALLKAVATPSTGTDHLDLDALARRGIPVLSLKDDRALLDRITATGELAWALMLACLRRIPEALRASQQGHWARDELRGRQIAYKTFGILGCGRLGTIVSQYARAFRMRVIGCDKLDIDLPGVEKVDFEQLLRESDVLSIHIHLTDENRNLFDQDAFAMMKPGSILINTSRGAILDESALLAALKNGPLAAAGLDVIDGEWLDTLADHPLIAYSRSHDNLIITPHIGGVTVESQEMAYSAAARKLIECLKMM